MEAFLFAQSDDDFYAPLGSEPIADAYSPANVPAGWTSVRRGIWTQWHTEALLGGVEQGWKIHVSASLIRCPAVLETAATILFAEGIPFKHVTCRRHFLIAHHKHATRQQSGKFITAYPADVATARRVMDALREALTGEDGPFVLTDRRYLDSSVVHYRYGSFVDRCRTLADGTQESLIRDGHGNEVVDRRELRFTLPDGVDDPFAVPDEPTQKKGSPTINGYGIVRAIRHSNAGGTYEGGRDERRVFIKEARAHNGLTGRGTDAQTRLRHEYDILRALDAATPGIAPKPMDYFRVWEHEFLVTEYIEGESLRRWIAAHNPIVTSVPTDAAFRAYYARCQDILTAIGAALDRMHALGYVFVDVNPDNVLITEDGPRLVDFEVAGRSDEPLDPIGVPGFFASPDVVGDEPQRYDDYGLSSLALAMIAELNSTADRNPAVLASLRAEVERHTDVPPSLWRTATRFRAARAEATDTDPAYLQRGLIRGLLAVADPHHPDHVFRWAPQGYLTNALSVADGLAGVVHALHTARVHLPGGLLDRLATDALAQRDELPPGLHVGSAGIAWVLAELGRIDEARAMLDAADDHAATATSATLGQGRAGIGLTHLALWHRTHDERHLDAALRAGASISRDDAFGVGDPTGLENGRPGVALLDFYLAAATGDHAHLERGLSLLHDELDRAVPADGGLLFPVSDRDRRLVPYLSMGSAGFGFVASRYLDSRDDDRLAEAMPAVLASADAPFTYYGGLFTGMAGLGLFLADHAQRTGDPDIERQAWAVAQRLSLYAIPRGDGELHVLGDGDLRLSSDLGSGSAGVLLMLDQLRHGRTDAFFTLDAYRARPATRHRITTVVPAINDRDRQPEPVAAVHHISSRRKS
jgi:hypothetical protein